MLSRLISTSGLYLSYFESIFDGFDPIIDGPSLPGTFPKTTKFHLKFFVPFLISFIVLIDSIVLIGMNDWKMNPLPELYHRTIMVALPGYWEQFDAIFSGCHIILPGTYLILTISDFGHRVNFLFRPKVDSKRLVDSNGRSLSTTLSEEQWAFRTRLLPHMKASKYSMIINFNIIYTGSFLYSFFFLVPRWTFRIVISLISCPFYMTYLGCSLTMGNYFWLTMKYLEIKQKFQLRRYERITRSLLRLMMDKKRVPELSYIVWLTYQTNLKHSIDIVKEIKSFNKFFSSLMSVIFVVYIYEICKITYMAVIAESNRHRLLMSPLIIIVGLHYVFIYIVTGTASNLISSNVQTYKSMRRFHTRYQLVAGSFRENLKICILECYSDYFRKGSFKLLNGYVINHRLLEVLLAYIALTSLKLHFNPS